MNGSKNSELSSEIVWILQIPPFCKSQRKEVSSDWLADQKDKQSIFGHAQFHKRRMKGDDLAINTAQTPKCFDGCLALLEKIQKTFTDTIP